MKVLLLAFALLAVTEARRFCKVDDDCTGLGDITCQYSRCDSWGICGCPRGFATRFMGSEKKFQCAMLKKLGESCSEDGSNGVCGPENSYCEGGKCRCMSNLVEAWDGEKCLAPYDLSHHFGETCSKSLGGCGTASCTSGVGFPPEADALDYDIPVCACGSGFRLAIPNAFDKSSFVGRREPECIPIKLGEQCMFNGDCTMNIGNSECAEDTCKCITGYEEASDGDCHEIATTTILGEGDPCEEKTGQPNIPGICGANMMCGDICVPDIFNDQVNNERKCVCKTGYTGSSCTPVTEGATCSGDWQCQGVGYDALCLDGACVAGAGGITFSLLTMLFMVVAHYV